MVLQRKTNGPKEEGVWSYRGRRWGLQKKANGLTEKKGRDAKRSKQGRDETWKERSLKAKKNIWKGKKGERGRLEGREKGRESREARGGKEGSERGQGGKREGARREGYDRGVQKREPRPHGFELPFWPLKKIRSRNGNCAASILG